MSNSLVIVESPAKAKTIKKYLGKDYTVKASMGHICDLEKDDMGIDMDDNFKPHYKTAKGKKKVISKLRKAQKNKDVILATDEDREGEAIARHITRKLDLDPDNTPRITFHEITKDALQEAIDNPRSLDFDLIDAQQGRRLLDRIVGFQISPVLWDKIKRGLSAGRVQSVAVKLIVEKERERQAFDPEEKWQISATSKFNDNKLDLKFYKDTDGNKKIQSQKTIKQIFENIGLATKSFDKDETKKGNIKLSKKTNDIDLELVNISKRKGSKKPYPPLTTSALQQTASNTLGRNVKTIMNVAQKLYENGHITYMRTDSTKLSKKALGQASKYIKDQFGEKYHQYRKYSSKGKNTQGAHEAIRPTNIFKTPKKINLTGKQGKLYRLIWQKTLASQMAKAQTMNTTYTFKPHHKKTDKLVDQHWKAKGQVITFEGFLKVIGKSSKKSKDILPEIDKGTNIKSQKFVGKQKFTKPPARYSEATLVKTLKKKGIGRPSTYAPTIDKIQNRGYIEKDGKRLKPKEIAFIVIDFLEDNFENLMDYEFTAHMEERLDQIAQGKLDYKKMLDNFRQDFEQKVQQAKESEPQELKVGRKCPECDSELVYKFSKNGKFIGCSNYPDCKHTERTEKQKERLAKLREKYEGDDCPAGGKVVVKMGKYGPFLTSSEYPDVKRIESIPDERQEHLEDKYGGKECEKCDDGTMHVKKKKSGKGKYPYFLGCSNYPDCKNLENIKLTKKDKKKLRNIDQI